MRVWAQFPSAALNAVEIGCWQEEVGQSDGRGMRDEGPREIVEVEGGEVKMVRDGFFIVGRWAGAVVTIRRTGGPGPAQ